MAQPEELPVLYEADLQDMREDPVIAERLERVRRMSESRVKFMKQATPGVFIIDRSLARRAAMHIVENPEGETPLD
jgi:hypothetical protein